MEAGAPCPCPELRRKRVRWRNSISDSTAPGCKRFEVPENNNLPQANAVTISGPYNITGPGDTASRRRLFVCKPATAAEEEPCARKILATVARRAFRRPVTDADLRPLLAFYKGGRTERDFDFGIEKALRALLVSPDFLFRIEQDPKSAAPGSAYRISDLELASRLSFFLWSTIPDDQLLGAGGEGQAARACGAGPAGEADAGR